MVRQLFGPLSFEVRLDSVPRQIVEALVEETKKLPNVAEVRYYHGPELVVELKSPSYADGVIALMDEIRKLITRLTQQVGAVAAR